MHHTHHGAVLTGDLVDSRNLTAEGLKSARDAVDAAFTELHSARSGDGGAPEFFRGDSWQALSGGRPSDLADVTPFPGGADGGRRWRFANRQGHRAGKTDQSNPGVAVDRAGRHGLGRGT